METNGMKTENGESEEDEIASDVEDCDDENENSLFVKCECLVEESVTNNYILHFDTTKESNPNIVVATPKKSVLYHLQNSQIAKVGECLDYKSKLIGCKFSNKDPNLFYTGSSDGCIKLFDLRTPLKPALDFRDTTVEDNKFKTFNCFDVSSNDRLLTAGTDTIGGDAFILFWDTRKQNVLGGYWESHTDDITQVKFHPEDMNKLISGAIDGLINVYDLTKMSEDDALVDTLNTESSIDKLSWFYNDNKCCISCITYTSDLQLWDLDDGEPYRRISRFDISDLTIKDVNELYLANCHQMRDGLLILAGSYSKKKSILRGLKVMKKIVVPSLQFTPNRQMVRDSSFNENNNILFTVGEKGLLNIWKVPKPFL